MRANTVLLHVEVPCGNFSFQILSIGYHEDILIFTNFYVFFLEFYEFFENLPCWLVHLCSSLCLNQFIVVIWGSFSPKIEGS